VKKIEQELEEANSAVKEKQLLYENCVKTVSSLEKSIKDHDNNRESRLKGLEKKIKSIKSQMQSSSKDLKVSLTSKIYLLLIFDMTIHMNLFIKL
jgi:structural maintenance of chromosome 2